MNRKPVSTSSFHSCWALALALTLGMAATASADVRTLPLATEAAKAVPCTPPDINGDGTVDYCDTVLLTTDIGSSNPRSDFNCDGDVDLDDISSYAEYYCDGPPAAASPSSVSIGVYFDAGGTISQLDNLPQLSNVDMYVVAHNATGIGGYAFELEFGSAFIPVSHSSPEGSIDVSTFNVSENAYALGGEFFCLPAGEATVLLQFRMFYLFGQNATVDIKPFVDCGVPAEHAAFISCAGSCEWSYFDPDANGMAVINPVDFNGNGQADVFEIPGLQFYQIQGSSDGTGWSMGIRDPDGIWGPYYSTENVLPPGAPASEFATAMVAWLNTISPSLQAVSVFNDDVFYVSVPGNEAFELGVGAFGATPDCWVTSGSGCSFNPVLEQIADPATGVPDRPIFGLSSYPNPFNPQTTIAFDLPAASQVDLRVYDPAGRLVRTLIAGRTTGAGHHEVVWDGRDENGAVMAAGLYVYRLDAAGRSESGNMVLVK